MFFDEKGCGRLVSPTEPLPDLGAFRSDFIWLHFGLKAANLCPLINAGHLGPRRLVEAVFRPDEHQRVTVKTEHVGGVVADLARPGAQPDAAGRLHFVTDPRSLVSERRSPAENPDATRVSAERGQPIPSPVLLLETMVGYVVASMSETGQRLRMNSTASRIASSTGACTTSVAASDRSAGLRCGSTGSCSACRRCSIGWRRMMRSSTCTDRQWLLRRVLPSASMLSTAT